LQQYSKEEILKLLKSGDKREVVFHWILSEYKTKLYWLVRRMVVQHTDADDVLQNVFIKVWQNMNKFRGDSDLYTWVYRIGINESLAFLNKKKNQAISMNDHGVYLSEHMDADSYFDGTEAQKQLQKAILQLPEQQRLVFNMRYFEEMKYQDMAKILGKSEGGLKANYHHAVKKIEEYLKDD
jgi:RNA polymerase sigma-70 factor (ECF subfamily)